MKRIQIFIKECKISATTTHNGNMTIHHGIFLYEKVRIPTNNLDASNLFQEPGLQTDKARRKTLIGLCCDLNLAKTLKKKTLTLARHKEARKTIMIMVIRELQKRGFRKMPQTI